MITGQESNRPPVDDRGPLVLIFFLPRKRRQGRGYTRKYLPLQPTQAGWRFGLRPGHDSQSCGTRQRGYVMERANVRFLEHPAAVLGSVAREIEGPRPSSRLFLVTPALRSCNRLCGQKRSDRPTDG